MYIQDEIARTINRLKRNYASEGLWRWVLRDVDFGIEPGGSLGIVGANGSGKSTLLKILARVMDPTAGSVRVGGRVGALIELRSGLHPNLSGRENIFFTGTLMGLRRREVAKRLDEIIAFSELESAIDRQVKYYSSGMQMRLGFGVAAFLQPAVLVVDEVLAVGDATFQQRCLDRMGHVLSEGTTLILVSHDLSAVEATCARALWMNEGQIVADGPVRDALAAYRAFVEADAEKLERIAGKVNVVDAHTGGSDGAAIVRSNAGFEVEFTVTSDGDYRAWFFLGVSEGTAAPIFLINPGHEVALQPGGGHRFGAKSLRFRFRAGASTSGSVPITDTTTGSSCFPGSRWRNSTCMARSSIQPLGPSCVSLRCTCRRSGRSTWSRARRCQPNMTLRCKRDRMRGYFEYQEDLYVPSAIESLVEDFETLLAAIASNPDTPVLALPPPANRPSRRPIRTISRTAN